MASYIVAIDQGTTSTRAIVFDQTLAPISSAQMEFRQIYPGPGWVEHDPEDLWHTVVRTVQSAIGKAKIQPRQVAAIGITNQRETTLIWDRKTGTPIHNAIVWQDRRTASACADLRRDKHEPAISAKTGLLLDPYFSATKIGWILDHVSGARAKAEAGQLAFGTVDTFLLWRLTGGRLHATDATNAARTLLCDIRKAEWDPELLKLFRVPASMLPEIRDCASDFGTTERDIFGARIPILGIAGDQQAATVGQGCFRPGMMKSTYGTGCFALLNTGDTPVVSKNRLLTTIAYQLEGKRTYALEGAIFVAGAAVQWMRDGLKMIKTAAESDKLVTTADPDEETYLVPAFVGLGAPWWDADARGTLFGLTRKTGPAEIARAALESVGIPDPRSAGGDAGGLAGRRGRRDGAARRRRADGQRLDHAVPCRHSRRAGRPADHHGDDRARRRLSGRAQGRHLPRPAALCRDLAARAALRAADGFRHAPAQMGGLAGCRAADAEFARTALSATRGMAAPLLQFDGVTKRYGELHRGRSAVARHFRGRVLRAARPVRLRQDYAAAPRGGLRAA